jgi:hypothetical protein
VLGKLTRRRRPGIPVAPTCAAVAHGIRGSVSTARLRASVVCPPIGVPYRTALRAFLARDSPLQAGGLSSRSVKSSTGQVERLWHQCQMTFLPALREGTLTSVAFALWVDTNRSARVLCATANPTSALKRQSAQLRLPGLVRLVWRDHPVHRQCQAECTTRRRIPT